MHLVYINRRSNVAILVRSYTFFAIVYPRGIRPLKSALENATECSSDPLCWENEDQLNLAACFSCCLVSETSCEKRNMGLDRRALIDSEFGFFKDLV